MRTGRAATDGFHAQGHLSMPPEPEQPASPIVAAPGFCGWVRRLWAALGQGMDPRLYAIERDARWLSRATAPGPRPSGRRPR